MTLAYYQGMKARYNMEYKQLTDEYQTQAGLIRITTTLKQCADGRYEFDDKFVVLNNIDLLIPDAWKHQTSSTIVRKICLMRGAK